MLEPGPHITGIRYSKSLHKSEKCKLDKEGKWTIPGQWFDGLSLELHPGSAGKSAIPTYGIIEMRYISVDEPEPSIVLMEETPSQVCLCRSLSLTLKGLLLYTDGVLFHVEC